MLRKSKHTGKMLFIDTTLPEPTMQTILACAFAMFPVMGVLAIAIHHELTR